MTGGGDASIEDGFACAGGASTVEVAFVGGGGVPLKDSGGVITGSVLEDLGGVITGSVLDETALACVELPLPDNACEEVGAVGFASGVIGGSASLSEKNVFGFLTAKAVQLN